MIQDTDPSPIVFDIETAGLPNAADYLEPIPDAVPDESPIEADKRLTDPVKVAADIEKKQAARAEQNAAAQAKVEQQRAARLEKTSLDWNVGRIVALAWWTERDGYAVRVCRDEAAERSALIEFWRESRYRTLIGFNAKGFDLKFMVQRSRLLGIAHPILDFSKYTRKGIADIYLDLTFNEGTYDQGAMRRTLHAFCRRFGIPVPDGVTGAEIPRLVAAGEWDAVSKHVMSDVFLTCELAARLNLIPEVERAGIAV